MSALPYFRLAALWLFALIAHSLARAAPAEPLHLVAEIDGADLTITDLRAGKFVAQDATGWRTVPLDAPVRVDGPLEANARLVFWTPITYTVRAPVRDSIPASARPWFGYVRLTEGSTWARPTFSQRWPEKLPDPLIAGFAWVLDGQVLHSVARRLPANPSAQTFRIDQVFALSERESAGFGVVLLWSNGRFVAPVPTYKTPEIEAVFHDIQVGGVAKLEAALTKGPDSSIGRERDSLLRHAVAAGSAKAVSTLLRHGARADQPIELSPLALAAFDGRTALLDLLLDANPTPADPPSFKYLARWGHDDIARRLLARAPASVTISDESLEEALAQGSTELARELLTRVKLDPRRQRQHAHILVRQVQLGYVAAAQLFLEHKADPNVTVDGCTPLGEAVRLGETALVEPLLHAGARPDDVDALNNTPLLYACLAGDLAVAERLLKAGANPKYQRRDGQTPLHFAASHATPALVNLLLAAGVDPNISAIRPKPLEIALMTGAGQTAATLAKAGARLDLNWPYHKHPLAAAVWLDIDPVVADVLARGWKPEGPIHGSWDAATIARLSGSTRSLALLTAHPHTAPAAAPTVVPTAELDSPLKLLNAPVAEDKREGRARNTTQPMVVVTGIVNETGQLLCPRIARSSDSRLNFAALRAIMEWRYAPALKNGAPICVQVTVLVSFAPTKRDVVNLGEVDTPPIALTDWWPTAAPHTYFNRARAPNARNDSIWHQDLGIQFVVAKDGVTHSGTIAPAVSRRAQEYLLGSINDSRFIPATRNGEPISSYFHLVIER